MTESEMLFDYLKENSKREQSECQTNLSAKKPTRCIDPVMKYCQECKWGYVIYPEWCETYEDTIGCTFEEGCTLGYDKGRPEDEPTEEEWKKFDDWCNKVYDKGDD